jgi:hypothetical protein
LQEPTKTLVQESILGLFWIRESDNIKVTNSQNTIDYCVEKTNGMKTNVHQRRSTAKRTCDLSVRFNSLILIEKGSQLQWLHLFDTENI